MPWIDASVESPHGPPPLRRCAGHDQALAKRRLYDTTTLSYATLDDLSAMALEGRGFVVYEADTGEDVTPAILEPLH